MFFTVGRSTPVESSFEVVAITGVSALDVGEVVEVLLPDVAFDRDDAHDVVRVLAREVGVGVVERCAHLVGVL